MKENYTELYPNEHVNKAVGDYSASHSTKLPQSILKHHALMSETHEEAEMMTSPFQSQFQSWIANVIGAKRVLEIGTFVGFSAMVWAHAVGSDGLVTTLEFDVESAATAKAAWAKSGIKNIELILGDARESLKSLARAITEPYDLVFIDADKESYPAYFSFLMANSAKDSSTVRILRPGALIIADNILRRGLVADSSEHHPLVGSEKRKQHSESWRSPEVEALDKFNNMMVDDERLETFLLPLFDGLGMARLKD